jgi:hypothetical protein
VARVASGLNQPNYVAQAPGDPSNIIYYTQRATTVPGQTFSIQGFNTVNHMGDVMRYDMTTGISTPVIDLTSRPIFNDDGLEGMAFNPDFSNPGTPGYGKMYISSSTYAGNGAFGSGGGSNNSLPLDRVEEYTTTDPSDPTTANTTFTKTILSYTNNSQNNHTIDQISFNPTAAGEARYYMYISTGNGSFGNNYNGGVNGSSGQGMPSQNPADVKGKILRVDVNDALPDAYPGDSNKNFAIPTDNPVPLYNAAHPTTPLQGSNSASNPIGTDNTPALGEVYITGLRNSYRFSFDRANGNMYLGDVGENSVEEIDIVKAGLNTGTGTSVYNSNGPVDFGWPEREGTHLSPVPANANGFSGPAVPNQSAGNTATNPFTGATSLNPIQQFTHTVGNAVIGGFVYRGPASTNLQGQYFYSDFVTGTIRVLNTNGGAGNFDPTSDPSTYNGANGTVTDMSSTLNSLVYDPHDATYTQANVGNPFGLDHVVSFGEDNSGNMFVVDFGGTAGDTSFTNTTGEYPAAGLGEIFEIVPNLKPGDFNGDGHVDAADISAMEAALANLNGFQAQHNLSYAAIETLGDLNGDRLVNNADLQSLLSMLKAGGGSTDPVPEPSGFVLIALEIVGLLALNSSRRGGIAGQKAN